MSIYDLTNVIVFNSGYQHTTLLTVNIILSPQFSTLSFVHRALIKENAGRLVSPRCYVSCFQYPFLSSISTYLSCLSCLIVGFRYNQITVTDCIYMLLYISFYLFNVNHFTTYVMFSFLFAHFYVSTLPRFFFHFTVYLIHVSSLFFYSHITRLFTFSRSFYNYDAKFSLDISCRDPDVPFNFSLLYIITPLSVIVLMHLATSLPHRRRPVFT